MSEAGRGEVLLRIEGLVREFEHRSKKLRVLDGLDAVFHRGDMAAIMGASGAGKSTLLQIIGTLDSPTGGKVYFEGEDVFARSAASLAKFRNEQIGFVFQFHHLLPEFTALENVMMPGLIARQRKPDAERVATELLERVGLKDRLHHKPGELSGGEQQRVAMSRALFMKPRLLLADEPTGNLDMQTGAGIHGLLKQLNEELGLTILVVTHDPRLAELMPQRYLVAAGKIGPLAL
jgi:lipoprotein-releasing system ATP-binding protein